MSRFATRLTRLEQCQPSDPLWRTVVRLTPTERRARLLVLTERLFNRAPTPELTAHCQAILHLMRTPPPDVTRDVDAELTAHRHAVTEYLKTQLGR